MSAVISACIFFIIKIGEFLCSQFEDRKKYAIILAYYVLLFQENAIEMQKKIVQCMEKIL